MAVEEGFHGAEGKSREQRTVLLQRGIQMQTSPLSGIQSEKSLLVGSAILKSGKSYPLRSQYPEQDCIQKRRLGFDRS